MWKPSRHTLSRSNKRDQRFGPGPIGFRGGSNSNSSTKTTTKTTTNNYHQHEDDGCNSADGDQHSPHWGSCRVLRHRYRGVWRFLLHYSQPREGYNARLSSSYPERWRHAG
ncbi:uncharacterized protein [Procambarus clarkii]|uniref:uncharacterized protein isoform X2 n=1 Tax=Procambarus clarkii TaxID=6728 RepID=UPI00374355DD